MKNFITSMLGTLAAFLVFAGVGIVLCLFLAGIAVSLKGRKQPRIRPDSYLVLDLSTSIKDAPPELDFNAFGDGRAETLQLRTVVHALRAAAHDGRIRGVLLLGSLKPDGFANGYAALREVRDALVFFRASGKPVKAYLDFATTRDYYVASAASSVYLNPYGLIDMPGLASEPTFYAGALEKYGVGVQVTRVGKYKSYVEPFIRKDMSPENREQIGRLLGDLWGGVIQDIAASRRISPGAIQSVVDAEGLIRPLAAKKAGLVDRIAYRDELVDELRADTGVREPGVDYRQVLLADYAKAVLPQHAGSGGSAVAIVYAEGDIVEGEGEPGEIGGARFAREIRRLREDSSVRAIVLRVNSPGGSASAAETIQREIRLARSVKPVVVSMGTYAASGGYWISAYADRIFAEPGTITGSIGVFGIQFDIQKLANGFGITFDSVKTGRFADMLTISRPKTGEELAVFQRLVDWIYGRFIAKVAEGRRLDPGYVQTIAQGRVWSGASALKLGLVDELGGLDAAVHYAAKRAGLGEDYRVEERPAAQTLGQAIAEMLGRLPPESLHLRQEDGIVGAVERQVSGDLEQLKAFNDPAGIYARLPMGIDPN